MRVAAIRVLAWERRIIKALLSGKDIYDLTWKCQRPQSDWDDDSGVLLRVIRDYINGKFKLSPLDGIHRKAKPVSVKKIAARKNSR